MLDANVIATLETSLRQTRNEQNRLMARLREAENDVQLLKEEIAALDNSAEQTASAIDTLLVMMRAGNRSAKPLKTNTIENEFQRLPETRNARPQSRSAPISSNNSPISSNNSNTNYRSNNSVAYLNQNRGIPNRSIHIEPISHRFSDRTITQACTLLLRESGVPLHVNELYNLLVAGGMEFKGNNPTISVAVSLNRNRRFRKVDPGTFDLIMREASQAAS